MFVLDATRGIPLVPGVHYTVGVSSATGSNDSLLEITPLRPLSPKTTYLFVLTSGISSSLGAAASPDQAFGAVRNAHVAGLDSVPGAPELNPLFPAIAPLIDAATGLLGIPGDAIAVAWSATTQSVSEVLEAVGATAVAMPHQVAPMGITTAHLGLGLPGAANLHAGWMQIPYYGDPERRSWQRLDKLGIHAAHRGQSAAVAPRRIAAHPGGRGSLPSLGEAILQMPAGRWCSIQHGVTSNRTTMIAIADAFAAARVRDGGHRSSIAWGHRRRTTPSTRGSGSPVRQQRAPLPPGQRRIALGSLVPDGQIDDGWQIFNVAQPAQCPGSRATGRVSDLFHLIRTVPGNGLRAATAFPISNANRIHFLGVSLGAIFGVHRSSALNT